MLLLITLRDYERQKKQGLDPVFDPKALGIKNADFWEHEYNKDAKAEAEKKTV